LEVMKWESSGIDAIVHAWRDAEGYEGAFEAAAHSLNLHDKSLGVEGLRMRVLEGQLMEEVLGAQVITADDVLVDLRIIKTPEEIEKHRKAIQISEQALERTLANLKLGMTERQIATMLSQFQTELGGSGDSFHPIALVGTRSVLPHGVPSDAQLQQGDALLLDFGTVYEGYVSDITRTFFVGEPSEQQRAVYEAVLAANTVGRTTPKPGIEPAEVDVATAQTMRDHGFGDYIRHRTGHGLGIDVHEHPNIVETYHRTFEPGMVFTIEPGLYIEGVVGVRIEDNVVITENGAESLTTFPRELRVLNLQ
jgi:Xaa-Pro dipeptidase